MGIARRIVLLGALLAVLLPLAVRAEDAGAEATPAFWLGKAEGLAARVEHPDGRAALLVSIGTGWVEAGELERAKPLLAGAVKYGRQCRGCIAKARRLAEIGLLQHRAGDEVASGETFGYAREACDELGEGAPRVQALAYLAQQRQAAGEAMMARLLFVEAEKAAAGLEGLEAVEAHAAIADAEAAAGNVEEARRASARLHGAALRQGRDGRAMLEASLMVRVLAAVEAGDLQEAMDLVQMVVDPRLKVAGLCAVARARPEGWTALGDALDLALAMPAGHDRADASLEVARVAAELGEKETAAKARALGADAAKDRPAVATLVLWADLTREAGDPSSARSILEASARLVHLATDDPARRAQLFGLLAAALVRAAAPIEAERLLVAVGDPVGRVRARLRLAEAYREAGNTVRALVVCGQQLEAMKGWKGELASLRAECRRQAAVLQARSGALDLALATVETIEKPFHAATACTYIARDLRD